MNIKVILFDADGVTVTAPGRGSAHVLEQAGRNPDALLPFFTNEFVECKRGKADVREEIKPYLEKAGWQESVEAFLRRWFDYENVIDQRVFEEIELYRKNGIFCALATDQEKNRKEYLLNEMNFREKFDAWYVSCDIGASKVEEDFFQHVLKDIKGRMPIEKDEVLLIDDTASVVHAAERFGIHTELYTDFEDFKQKMKRYGF